MSFVDGYLVAAPSRALVLEAIAHRDAGTTLTASQAFRERLPSDAETDFSALFWQDLSSVSGSLGQILGGAVPESEREQIEAMAQGIEPMLVLAYGDADRVRLVSRGGAGPLGLSFEKLLALVGIIGSHVSTDADEPGPVAEEGAGPTGGHASALEHERRLLDTEERLTDPLPGLHAEEDVLPRGVQVTKAALQRTRLVKRSAAGSMERDINRLGAQAHRLDHGHRHSRPFFERVLAAPPQRLPGLAEGVEDQRSRGLDAGLGLRQVHLNGCRPPPGSIRPSTATCASRSRRARRAHDGRCRGGPRPPASSADSTASCDRAVRHVAPARRGARRCVPPARECLRPRCHGCPSPSILRRARCR